MRGWRAANALRNLQLIIAPVLDPRIGQAQVFPVNDAHYLGGAIGFFLTQRNAPARARFADRQVHNPHLVAGFNHLDDGAATG